MGRRVVIMAVALVAAACTSTSESGGLDATPATGQPSGGDSAETTSVTAPGGAEPVTLEVGESFRLSGVIPEGQVVTASIIDPATVPELPDGVTLVGDLVDIHVDGSGTGFEPVTLEFVTGDDGVAHTLAHHSLTLKIIVLSRRL
jgi:hypothetical protein